MFTIANPNRHEKYSYYLTPELEEDEYYIEKAANENLEKVDEPDYAEVFMPPKQIRN
jgi:hypothetical protein